MAPAEARMPNLRPAPSKAGPAGVAQAQQPCLEPRQSSALVPMSTMRERESARWVPQRSRSAVMSGPT